MTLDYINEIIENANFDNSIALESTTINVEAYPSELISYDQWILWKLEGQTEGKPKKVPYTTNGFQAKTNDRTTWTSFDESFEIYRMNSDTYSGLGFVFTEADPFIGIDYDHVIDSMGIIDPEIMGEINIWNSYAEISQSGTGIHVIVTGTMPGPRKRGNGCEMYSSGQFIAITGNHLKGTSFTVNEAPEEVIRAIYHRMIKPVEDSSKSKIPADENSKEPKVSARLGTPDFGILDKCKRAKNSDRFNILYGGNWEILGCYPSQSEADLALCSLFAAYTQDKSQIDRLFTGSGLYSEKWNRDDYKGKTINKALVRINEDPQRKYFSEGRFIVKSLADEIMNEYQFITFDDNKETYSYKNGVYRPGGKDLILRLAQAKLGNYSKKSYGDEVKYYIQCATPISRNLVDKDMHIINLKNGLMT